MATAAEAARHLFIGDRRFRELLESNVLTRQERGDYNLDDIRKEYIEHLRTIAAGRGLKSEYDLSEERAKLAREQAEGVALKNAIARGEYVAIEDVVEKVEGEYSIVRERLLTIPGKIADSLVGRDRDKIETLLQDEVFEALNELHAPADGGLAGPN